VSDQPPGDSKDRSLSDEISWTLKRCSILFRYWTMPVTLVPPIASETPDDRTSSRAFALLIIVALTFAVRGDVGTAQIKVSYATLAAALAAVLSVLLNFLSKIKITITDREIISAYSSIIVTMILYVTFQTVFEGLGFNWYRILTQEFGSNFAPALLATIATYVLLTLKARFYDRNTVGFWPAVHGLGVTICAGLIVWTISYASNDFFNWIIGLANRA
jgi:hypothetical protein